MCGPDQFSRPGLRRSCCNGSANLPRTGKSMSARPVQLRTNHGRLARAQRKDGGNLLARGTVSILMWHGNLAPRTRLCVGPVPILDSTGNLDLNGVRKRRVLLGRV